MTVVVVVVVVGGVVINCDIACVLVRTWIRTCASDQGGIYIQGAVYKRSLTIIHQVHPIYPNECDGCHEGEER